ncbi:MAG: lipid II flippase MurJ [Chloroflexota bacterium]
MNDKRRLVGPAIFITIFAVGAQVTAFVIQLTLANLFGSTIQMDAFVAANTLPDYLIAILVGVLSVVFIPVFMDYEASGREEDAWIVTSGILNTYLLLLGILTLIGVLFSRSVVQLITPGLPPDTLDIASHLAIVLWPTVLGVGVFSLLSGIYQVRGHFSWPAIASLLGQIINLILVIVLTPLWGVTGAAIGVAANILLQVLLLARIWLRQKHYHFGLYWRHPGIRQVLHLLWPLLVSGIVIRWTPVVDRYLVSSLPVGSISHLNYAFKIVEGLSLLLSTGISVVIFPQMALNVSQSDTHALKQTISQGLRLMWLAVAPAIFIGIALAIPIITILYQRGEFSAADTEVVAALMRVYLFALVGMSLGSVTGRSFYALKDTRTPAVIGTIQAFVYIVYAVALVHFFGVFGAAIAYVIYFNVSLLWQVVVIRLKTGGTGGRLVIGSFGKTCLAAIIAGLSAWGVIHLMASPWLQLISGAAVSLVMYLAILLLLRSTEIALLLRLARQQFAQRLKG